MDLSDLQNIWQRVTAHPTRARRVERQRLAPGAGAGAAVAAPPPLLEIDAQQGELDAMAATHRAASRELVANPPRDSGP